MEKSKNEIKELVIIKQLYMHGSEHGKLPGSINRIISILNIHNSVEILLKLLAYKFGLSLSKQLSFYDILQQVDKKYLEINGRNLPSKKQISDLHDQRNLVQHSADSPSIETVEKYSIYMETFLKEVIEKDFEVKFEEISLVDYIENEAIRKLLKQAEFNMNNSPNKSILQIICALEWTFENIYDFLKSDYSENVLPYTSYWIDRLVSIDEISKSKVISDDSNGLVENEIISWKKEDIKRNYINAMMGLEKKLSRNISIFGIGVDLVKYMKFQSIVKNWRYVLSYQKGNKEDEVIKWISVYWPKNYSDQINNSEFDFILNFVTDTIFEIENKGIKIKIDVELREFIELLIKWDESCISINDIEKIDPINSPFKR